MFYFIKLALENTEICEYACLVHESCVTLSPDGYQILWHIATYKKWIIFPCKESLVLMNVNDLHFHWLYVQSINTRLVMMSASLHTQTVLHCLIIQVIHTRVCCLNIWYTSLTSVHSHLEHGLAILTESFSPLKSALHNLSCWSLNQMFISVDTQYNFLTLVALHSVI